MDHGVIIQLFFVVENAAFGDLHLRYSDLYHIEDYTFELFVKISH